MEEEVPAPVENPSPMPPPAPAVVAEKAETRRLEGQSARRRGGFLSRFLAAVLVLLITTFIVLFAVGAALLNFGYVPDLPRQLGAAQAQLGTVQAQSLALQLQNNVLQTQVAAQGQRADLDHEVIGDLKSQIANVSELRNQLRQEREQSVSQNATLVAEARSSRDAVALFATAEAGRAALLADLDRRSARVERFLQRLSDISGDTALDLGAATQPALPSAAIPAPTTISEPSPTPTPTAAPTSTGVPTEPPTPTPAARATRSPSATPRQAAPTTITELSPTPTLGR
jgi:hypothetical protein